MYIKFHQNWVSRSVKTVRTNIFVKNCKLHKFATTNSNLKNNRLFPTCVIVNCINIPIFSETRFCRSVKIVQTNLFEKNRKLHKFTTTNSNFEKA